MTNKKVSALLVSALLVLFACNVSGKEPSVAGSFYPSDKKELKETVGTFLLKAEKIPANGRLIAMISPHAGYKYSGQVAAYGYKEM
jgi:MEMO1 family protein